jgi:hypothetical protein
MRSATIKFQWDEDAKVFCITSDDVPGLVLEASNFLEAGHKLQLAVPALLAANAEEV